MHYLIKRVKWSLAFFFIPYSLDVVCLNMKWCGVVHFIYTINMISGIVWYRRWFNRSELRILCVHRRATGSGVFSLNKYNVNQYVELKSVTDRRKKNVMYLRVLQCFRLNSINNRQKKMNRYKLKRTLFNTITSTWSDRCLSLLSLSCFSFTLVLVYTFGFQLHIVCVCSQIASFDPDEIG